MGIKDCTKALTELCPHVIEPLDNIGKFQGKTFALEVCGFMYKFCYSSSDTYLQRFLQQWQYLKDHHINVIYVFDGAPAAAKSNEIDRRRKQRAALEKSIESSETELFQVQNGIIAVPENPKILISMPKDLTESDSQNSVPKRKFECLTESLQAKPEQSVELCENLVVQKQQQYVDSAQDDLVRKRRRLIAIRSYHYNALRVLLKSYDIPYVDAEKDGERMCVMLCKMGIADVVVTDDTDALAYGSPVTIRNFGVRGEGATVIHLERVLDSLGFSYESFVDFCILCGCDFTRTIPGIGWKKAHEILQKHRSIPAFLQSVSGVLYREKARSCNYEQARKEFFITKESCDVMLAIVKSERSTLFSYFSNSG